MQQRVTINGKLQTLNEMIADARVHWSISAKNKKFFTNIVRLHCLKMKTIQYPCTMSFEWHYSGKEDFDNIRAATKFILDGMQEAKKLPNDNQKWVIGFEGDAFIKVPKGQDKVVVTIVEYEP